MSDGTTGVFIEEPIQESLGSMTGIKEGIEYYEERIVDIGNQGFKSSSTLIHSIVNLYVLTQQDNCGSRITDFRHFLNFAISALPNLNLPILPLVLNSKLSLKVGKGIEEIHTEFLQHDYIRGIWMDYSRDEIDRQIIRVFLGRDIFTWEDLINFISAESGF